MYIILLFENVYNVRIFAFLQTLCLWKVFCQQKIQTVCNRKCISWTSMHMKGKKFQIGNISIGKNNHIYSRLSILVWLNLQGRKWICHRLRRWADSGGRLCGQSRWEARWFVEESTTKRVPEGMWRSKLWKSCRNSQHQTVFCFIRRWCSNGICFFSLTKCLFCERFILPFSIDKQESYTASSSFSKVQWKTQRN